MGSTPRIPVRTRRDITPELVHAVAWLGAGLEIAPEALAVMDRCQESFEAFVSERVRNDPQALVYGVTSAPGDAAAAALTDEARAGRPTQLWTAMSFGESLPDRVVRAILVARLANFLDGHAAVRGDVARAVANMLDDPVVNGVVINASDKRYCEKLSSISVNASLNLLSNQSIAAWLVFSSELSTSQPLTNLNAFHILLAKLRPCSQ